MGCSSSRSAVVLGGVFSHYPAILALMPVVAVEKAVFPRRFVGLLMARSWIWSGDGGSGRCEHSHELWRL